MIRRPPRSTPYLTHSFPTRRSSDLLAETHLRQRFGNRLGVEFAHAVEADRCNGGPFLHGDHQHIVAGVDFYIAEDTRGIKALNGLGSLGIGELFADLDRQIAEDSAGIAPLYAVSLDIDNGRT